MYFQYNNNGVSTSSLPTSHLLKIFKIIPLGQSHKSSNLVELACRNNRLQQLVSTIESMSTIRNEKKKVDSAGKIETTVTIKLIRIKCL